MNSKSILLPVLAASLLGNIANAQVNVTITGSTAFRAITFDRARVLFDTAPAQVGDFGNGPGTYSGTMSNAIPALGATPVNLRLSFSGSATGMAAVDSGTPIPTIQPGTGTIVNQTPDISLSDVYPESASPPLDGSHFEQAIVGVIPFVYVANNSLATVTNITKEQAILLMNASGVVTNFGQPVYGMPASFLGGASTNPVYLTGRDSGSGTRITVHKVLGYTGTPRLWGNQGSTLVQTNGYSSGGGERGVISTNLNVLGYLGLSDYNSIAGSAHQLAFEGVPFTINGVQSGNYPLWGYEHLVSRLNLSANQALVRDALVAAISNQGFQTTNALYTAQFVDQANMHVRRGTDGGTITSLDF